MIGTSSWLAFDASILAVANGATIIAREPDSEFAERWRTTLAGNVLALAIAGEALVALDDAGTATVFDSKRGATIRAIDVGRGAALLAGSSDGAFVAAGPQGVVLVTSDEPTPIDLRGATALAISGNRLAIGTREGAVRVVDTRATRALGACRVGGAVRGLAAGPRGFVASTDHALVHVDRTASEAFEIVDTKELELGLVACDASGALGAARIGDRRVGIFDLLEGKLRGTVTYASPVVGVAWCAGRLGVGLDDGSFDIVDLATGEGLPNRSVELRLKVAEIIALVERATRGEQPAPDITRRPVQGGAPTPTPAAIAVMIGLVAVTLAILWLLRAP